MTDYTDAILTMSDTEELHSPVSDTETAIIVNEGTRGFSFPDNFNMVIGVVGDHNSEVVSFLLPRYIDNHDVSECAEHRIIWKRTTYVNDDEKVTEGYFDTDDIKISEDDESKVLLGWLISNEVTEEAGEISFALQLSDYDADGEPSYRWKTIYGEGLLIVDGPDSGEYPETIRKNHVNMVDQTTGAKYKLYVADGKLRLEESEG